MKLEAILLATLAASALLVWAAGAVAANGDHDHGEDDGGLPDWVPDFVADLLDAIGGLFGGVSAPGAGLQATSGL